MARFNGYFHRIGVSESDLYMRISKRNSQALSLPIHYMGCPTKQDASTTDRIQGNLLYYLGGKAPSDAEKWAHNMDAARATISFAIATDD